MCELRGHAHSSPRIALLHMRARTLAVAALLLCSAVMASQDEDEFEVQGPPVPGDSSEDSSQLNDAVRVRFCTS